MLKEIKRLAKLLEINKKGIVVTKSNAKEADKDIIREMHGTDFMPDDFRFSTLNTLLNQLVDYDVNDLDRLEDVRHEIVDDMVDIYNFELTKWLSSNLRRLGYCDEANDSGLCVESSDLITRIRLGQYLEIDEIMSNIVNHLDDISINSEDI